MPAVSHDTNSQIDSKGIKVFPLDSAPYNTTYSEWTAKWWKWALEIPKEQNPVSDTTGKNCAQGQEGPVWFLAGTYGGAAERSCTIPAGKPIVWNPISQECSYAEFSSFKTEAELRKCVKDFQDKVTDIEVVIDGIKLANVSKYRIQSPMFNFTLPENNVLGLPSQPTQGVSDGVWVFLHPLTPGKHEIRSKGVSVDFTSTGVQNFVADVTYHLDVRP